MQEEIKKEEKVENSADFFENPGNDLEKATFAFIYPYVQRVANGELTVHDIIQILEKEE